MCLGNRKIPAKAYEKIFQTDITNMTINTAELKRGAIKHCSWGLFKSDSCYPESMSAGTHFISTFFKDLSKHFTFKTLTKLLFSQINPYGFAPK